MGRGGEIIPTLNAFDVGDGREVVAIIDGTRVGDVRVTDEEIMQTVIQRWGTGGGNVPAIAYEENEPLVMREREGKAGGEGSIDFKQGFHSSDFELSHHFP